jgi:hypothetical protein
MHCRVLLIGVAMSGLAYAYTTAELKAMPKGGAACTDDTDCWGNGDCIASHCSCDEAWTGATCQVLSLIPADPAGALNKAGWSSWGG